MARDDPIRCARTRPQFDGVDDVDGEDVPLPEGHLHYGADTVGSWAEQFDRHGRAVVLRESDDPVVADARPDAADWLDEQIARDKAR